MKRVRWGMRTVMFCGVSALALSGCATKLTATDAKELLGAFHDAGCGGSVVVDVRGGTGQLGGSASGQFTANGSCPVGPAPVTPASPAS